MRISKIKFAFSSLLILSLLVIGGCSSDDNAIDADEDDLGGGNSTISMKVDGETWESPYTTLLTGYDDEESQEEYMVMITASRDTPDEETAQSLSITLVLDSSKFANPKGTYPFYIDDSNDALINYAQAVYVDFESSKSYLSGNPEDFGNSSGEFKITDYKIGDQVYGAGKGYLTLSGTFSLDMYTINSTSDVPIKIEITEGVFNLEHDFLY